MSAALRSRVQKIVAAAGDKPVPATWSRRLQSHAGKVSEYAQDLGKLMDERGEMIARAAVIAPPDWALVQLGAMPAETDDAARRGWAARVAAVGVYREMYGVDPDTMNIGAARDADPVRHVAWHRAWEALGRPQEQRDRQELSSQELREQIARWDREQQWAPVYAAREVEQSLTLVEEYRRESVHRWAQVDAELTATAGEITDEAQQLVDRAERARLAAEELERREESLVAPEAEQVPLLDERGGTTTEYAREAIDAYDAVALQGELLSLDEPAAAPEPRSTSPRTPAPRD
jgi:hypothetical protein